MADISAIKLPNGDIFDLVDEKSGYITAEIDPLFSASAAAGITSTDISNWNAKVSDDKTWNGVELDKTGTTQSSTSYIPARSNTSATTAYQLIATTEPYRYRVAKWDDNAYLYSTTPSANDNSTKVATTAYVDNAVGGISVPTKTSDLTNDSGYITSAAIPALLSGTTLTVTPTQVKNALANNQNVEITHTDATFGSYKLYDFILSSTQDILCAPLIGQYGGNWFAFELLGNATNDTWSTLTTLLATASDLPTKTSDLTNDSGFVTTDTNTTYTLSNALSSHKFISTLTAGGSGSGTSTATMEFVAGTGITLTDDTTNKKITIASSVVNTDEKLKVTTISATGSQNFFVLSGNSDNSENKKRSTSALSYYLTSDNKSILTMGASNIMGQIQLIYGDSGGHKVTIQPSSMTGGGDKTITFPDATGTLALTSDIPPIPLIPTDLSDLNNDLNVSDFPNDAGYITGYTETDPIFTASAAYGISASDITNWNGKQAALVSGTNIKTINNTSILGSGNISIVASGTSIPTADTVAEFDNDAHMNSTDMTSQEVEDFVDGLNVTASTLVDYIVEQGTSDIWTYRKWNSGIAECWGITAETTLSFSAWGDMYEAKVCDAVPFPTNLYITVPTVVANAIPTSGYAIMSTEFTAGGVTTSQIPALYAIRPNTASGITARVHIHVIGRWK